MKKLVKKLFVLKIKIAKFNRQHFIIKTNKRMKKNISIISSNCIAGIIYNDLNLPFMSPTINLYFYPDDFIKFVSNLDFYLNSELTELVNQDVNYPVGLLNNEIKIFFMHYKSFNEAKIKWIERCKRVNLENLYIIMTDRDGCTLKNIEEFDSLKYENKIIFTSKRYDNFKSCVYCSEYESKDNVGMIMNFRNIFGKRIYDKYFDFIEWFKIRY